MGRPKREVTTEQKVEQLFNLAYNDNEIAKELGLKVRTVRLYRSKMGLAVGHPVTKKWLEESGVGAEWDEVCRKIKGDR